MYFCVHREKVLRHIKLIIRVLENKLKGKNLRTFACARIFALFVLNPYRLISF